jgi:putative endonuclease
MTAMARRGDGGGGGLPRARPLPKAAPRPERQLAFRTGISAESRAAAFLIAKGFRILARRWKSPAGEIDIVARRRALLVFVEVKARATLDEAAESLLGRQQRRIAAAAEAWLAAHGSDGFRDMRFDAILVAPGKMPRHIPGAFET